MSITFSCECDLSAQCICCSCRKIVSPSQCCINSQVMTGLSLGSVYIHCPHLLCPDTDEQTYYWFLKAAYGTFMSCLTINIYWCYFQIKYCICHFSFFLLSKCRTRLGVGWKGVYSLWMCAHLEVHSSKSQNLYCF